MERKIYMSEKNTEYELDVDDGTNLKLIDALSYEITKDINLILKKFSKFDENDESDDEGVSGGEEVFTVLSSLATQVAIDIGIDRDRLMIIMANLYDDVKEALMSSDDIDISKLN